MMELIVAFIVAMLLIFVPAFWLDSASCAAQTEIMQLKHSWGPLQGCMVKVGEDWLPLSSYSGQQAIHK